MTLNYCDNSMQKNVDEGLEQSHLPSTARSIYLSNIRIQSTRLLLKQTLVLFYNVNHDLATDVTSQFHLLHHRMWAIYSKF